MDRRNAVGLVSAGLLTLSLGAQSGGTTTLRSLRDHSRPLLIFAPKPDDPQLRIQLRTLQEHAAEVSARDLVAVAMPFRNPGSTPVQLSPDEAEAARRQFGVKPGEFAVILIGKDGREKLRSPKPLTMQRLDETIDAMPMRQEEVRGQAPR